MLSRCSRRAALSSLALAAASSAALAGPNNRTDVTFGEFSAPTSYASVNGTKAWAFGSFTCNIGLDNLAWGGADGTPAFVSNLYRLHNGRMTMIGMSWAKHSFAVGNSTGICGTCPAGAGAGLRPQCRDVYSASINGSQARLGPRSLINPFDGTFAPRTTQTFNSIDRRLQARESDLNPANFPGALYFAESIYVASDEAPSAQLNNASFTRVTFDASYNVALAGATSRERPAIFAWKENGLGLNTPDPSIQVVTADFPNEGRVYVAGKASRASNGAWRYEYMVFNLNSHIGVGTVAVPVGPGGIVGNLGSFAPTYHSGEAVVNTPWLAVRSGPSVAWTTAQKASENPNANGIRWGTTHNYWFESATPPAAALGQVAISGFRTDAAISAPGLPVPACAGDFDSSGLREIEDVFVYLTAWFASCTGDAAAPCNGRTTDVSLNGSRDIDDLFIFLNSWFAGC